MQSNTVTGETLTGGAHFETNIFCLVAVKSFFQQTCDLTLTCGNQTYSSDGL